jgi:hypothetical protein
VWRHVVSFLLALSFGVGVLWFYWRSCGGSAVYSLRGAYAGEHAGMAHMHISAAVVRDARYYGFYL